MKDVIYQKYYNKGKKIYNENGKEELKEHAEKVREISKYICSLLRLKSGLSRTIQLGVYLHDIGKTKTVIYDLCSAKEHNKLGAKYMNKFLENDTSSKEKEMLKNIIKYHRGDMPKKRVYKNIKMAVAITVVRTADKFASNFEDIKTIRKKLNNLQEDN